MIKEGAVEIDFSQVGHINRGLWNIPVATKHKGSYIIVTCFQFCCLFNCQVLKFVQSCLSDLAFSSVSNEKKSRV